jgi:hypothetical protein
MNFSRTQFLGGFALALIAAPAFAGVVVKSPANDSQVSSPFTLSASAGNCSSQTVIAMGYSLDSSSTNTTSPGNSINVSITSAPGAHTVHVKAWGKRGSTCVTDIAVTVEDTQASPFSLPAGVIDVSSIQSLLGWAASHDSGSSGTSTGHTSVVSSPSLSGNARKFVMSFTNYGGERFYASFGDDTTSTNFIYDAWVYVSKSTSDIANLEFDMNQVMDNGQTVIYGFQCDGWSGTWDYTANTGTPTQPVDIWVHSPQPCNPRNWSTNVWHHIQIGYSRDSSGNVTYDFVYLDGAAQPINATVPSAFALGWSPTLLTNFQIDGYTASGTATVLIDNLQIYRW